MAEFDEADYAKKVVGWLESKDLEVYKEVDAPGGSDRAIDIYAIKGDPERPRHALGVEVKTACTLRVMEQAEYWKRYSDKTAIAVPEAASSRSRAFAAKICREFGLGIILVPEDENGPLSPRYDVRPSGSGKLDTPELDPALKEREAGSAGNDPSVSFLKTERQLQEVARELPGIQLSDALERIDHHYKNRGSAFSSLRSATLQGIRTKRKRGKTYLFPISDE